jgi:hypothetical protein
MCYFTKNKALEISVICISLKIRYSSPQYYLRALHPMAMIIQASLASRWGYVPEKHRGW